MKYIICLGFNLVVFVAFNQMLLSQDFDSSIVQKFINAIPYDNFDGNDLNNSEKVPMELAKIVLGNVINDHVNSCYLRGVVTNTENLIFLLEKGYPEGGMYSDVNLICLSYVGKIILSEHLCTNMLDNGGGQECEISLIKDSILEVKQSKLEADDNYDLVELMSEYNYYIISEACFTKVSLPPDQIGRKYPDVSKRIIKQDELLALLPEELDIMRNEIFAGHGYIFKTQKWKNYFAGREWYNPRFEDVTDSLTVIERINIENILATSPR